MTEHPFAQYVRILGKGPNLSRPLTREECREAAGMVLRGEVEPVQLGAFLCLLRVKTETPEEIAGFVEAVRETLDKPADAPAVDLDWPSYAGKSRQLPWFVLSALMLAQGGVKVFMHGTEGHTAGRVYTRETLQALGIAPASSLAEAAGQIKARNFAYLPLEFLSPRLFEIMGLRSLLGVRSPIHTIARSLDPFSAHCVLTSVSHPSYRDVHQQAAQMLGRRHMAVFKGEGGEIERRPEKPCMVFSLHDGEMGQEEWPPILSTPTKWDEAMDLSRLKAVWSGEEEDEYAVATITGTAAVALKSMGRAASIAEAEDMARSLWQARHRERLLAA
ncbi:glycosyl transferase family protein [Telmatospirillum sp. J64-1]|uniref:glycosyl transferase family protein n=1 Tax=Telmatospirillum sp. J64-1 TaxID=2502183 RepID=UPI00115C7AFD|nr:glycosyl transferase family protein [Telmatospirillum sp. J64-1]